MNYKDFTAGDLVEVWVRPNESHSTAYYTLRVEEHDMTGSKIPEDWVKRTFPIIGFQKDKLTLHINDPHVEGWSVYSSDTYYDKIKGQRISKEKLTAIRGWFVNELGAILRHIPGGIVVPVHREIGGITCSNCKEFIFYAEGNQPDGTLICFSCRQDPARCSF